MALALLGSTRRGAAQDAQYLAPRGGGAGQLEAAPGPKYKAALSAAYAAGLRVSEVVALKVSDIDSERLLLRIEQGKGRKDRFAMLSPQLLELLRDWYRIAQPAVWLFPGRDPMLPLTTRQLNRAVHAAAVAGINSGDAAHLAAQLRHPLAEQKTDGAGSRFCSDMPGLIRPRSTRRSPPTRSAPS